MKSRVYTTSVIQAGLFLIVVFIILLLAGLVVPMQRMFGTDPSFQTLAQQAFLAAITMGSLAIGFSIIETAQLAELQLFKANKASCIGVLLSAASTVFVFKYLHLTYTPALLVLLIYGVPLLPRLANCATFLQQYDVAKIRLSDFDKSYFLRSLKSNTKFTGMQLATFLFDGYGIIWIGKLYGQAQAGKVSILVNLCVGVFGSVVMMLLLPTWPMLARAFASANVVEYRKTLKRLYLVLGSYSALVFVGFMSIGNLFIRKLYGQSMVPDFALLLSVMAYYFLNRFDTVGFMTLVASDGDNEALIGQTFKTIFGLGIAFVFSKFMGESFFYAGLFIGTLLTTSWYYFYAIQKSIIRRAENPHVQDPISGDGIIAELEIQDESFPLSGTS